MPSLFRRKSADLADPATEPLTPAEEEAAEAARSRAYTPAKGRETPKRPVTGRRPAGATKPLSKDEAKALRRERRAEAAAEFRREGGPATGVRSGCWPATWSTPGVRSAPGSSAAPWWC
ncbi:hypothetical protein GCM10029963_66400 [Micromonospora andamanensis]